MKIQSFLLKGLYKRGMGGGVSLIVITRVWDAFCWLFIEKIWKGGNKGFEWSRGVKRVGGGEGEGESKDFFM